MCSDHIIVEGKEGNECGRLLLEKAYYDQTEKAVAICEVLLINDALCEETCVHTGRKSYWMCIICRKVDMTQPLKC